MTPAEYWLWDCAQRLQSAAIVDIARVPPVLLLRCNGFRVEACPGCREMQAGRWALRQPAAAALPLVCNSPLFRLALQEGAMLLVAQGWALLQVCNQVFARWGAAPILLDVFST